MLRNDMKGGSGSQGRPKGLPCDPSVTVWRESLDGLRPGKVISLPGRPLF